MDLETVADELYGLRPADFTSARDDRAAQARKSGDRDLASAIKSLRRPTTSAWLANLLSRTRSEQVADLLDMGAALRQAQANLSGDELRRLSAQRHRVVSALAQEARRVAYDQGERISDAVQQELEGTLEAALADPRAGEAVSAGRLTSALSYSGLGEVDLSSVVSLGAAGSGTGSKPVKGTKKSSRTEQPVQPVQPAQQDADRQRRQRAEEALTAARERLTEAQRAAAETSGEADEASRRVDELTAEDQQLRERIDELESDLDKAQERATRLASEVREAKRTRTAADRAASTAARRLEQAESAVEAAQQLLTDIG